MSLLHFDPFTCWQVDEHFTAMPVPWDHVFLVEQVEHIAIDLGS